MTKELSEEEIKEKINKSLSESISNASTTLLGKRILSCFLSLIIPTGILSIHSVFSIFQIVWGEIHKKIRGI